MVYFNIISPLEKRRIRLLIRRVISHNLTENEKYKNIP